MTFIWRHLLSVLVIVDKWLWKTNSVACGLLCYAVIFWREQVVIGGFISTVSEAKHECDLLVRFHWVDTGMAVFYKAVICCVSAVKACREAAEDVLTQPIRPFFWKVFGEYLARPDDFGFELADL